VSYIRIIVEGEDPELASDAGAVLASALSSVNPDVPCQKGTETPAQRMARFFAALPEVEIVFGNSFPSWETEAIDEARECARRCATLKALPNVTFFFTVIVKTDAAAASLCSAVRTHLPEACVGEADCDGKFVVEVVTELFARANPRTMRSKTRAGVLLAPEVSLSSTLKTLLERSLVTCADAYGTLGEFRTMTGGARKRAPKKPAYDEDDE